INEPEQNDVCVKSAPERTETLDQTIPIELVAHGVDDVRHVRTVIALPLHDQSLRPDHLLGRDQERIDAEDLVLHGVLEPTIVHPCHAIAGTEDEIDEILALAVRLAEPVRKSELA